MPMLLLNRSGDRPPTAGEIAQFLRRKFGTRGRFEVITRRPNCQGNIIELRPQLAFIALVVAMIDPEDEFYRQGDNIHRKDWFQRDHLVVGYASAANMADASWQALASANRGNLQQLGLTTWCNRTSGPDLSQHYGFFQRATRIPPTFHPVGPELPAHVLQRLLLR